MSMLGNTKILALPVVIACLLSSPLLAQGLSPAYAKTVNDAREKYYRLEQLGLQSFKCTVNFDFDTVPELRLPERALDRKLLEATVFTLAIQRTGPTVEHHYPPATSQTVPESVTEVTRLITSLISGFFQTWPSKGLQGPVPPFDSEIESVARASEGYVFTLRVPGGPVRVQTDKNFLATDILSNGGKLHERPTYLPSPAGLVFAGNSVEDDSGQGGRVYIRYEIETAEAEGFILPSRVHLKVNDNIDVKFALVGCTVERAKVVTVKTPPAKTQ